MKDTEVLITSNADKNFAYERDERVVSVDEIEKDAEFENVLRPKNFEGYIGQKKAKENLAVSIASAKMRQDTLDHVLLYGPPGLGKTTLAHIVANEMGANIKVVSAPALERGAELAQILTTLSTGDVLFIDEIHRLKHDVAEFLYSAMEDFKLDLPSGKGMGASLLHLDVPKFTLIGATTKIGMIAGPLRDRFGIILRLESYSVSDLNEIVFRSAGRLGIDIERSACDEIARRSRGTPRIANRFLKRVRDYSIVKKHDKLSVSDAENCLEMLGVDPLGLDSTDMNVLSALAEKFDGGPCGLSTLAASINEDESTIEDVYEPYLLQLGFIARTPRGRVLLKKGYDHLGITYPEQE